MRPRLGLGLGLVRLLWTWQGSWRSAVPRRGVAAGPPLSAQPTGTHRPCLLPKLTPRLFRSLCGSKERTDSYALGVAYSLCSPQQLGACLVRVITTQQIFLAEEGSVV